MMGKSIKGNIFECRLVDVPRSPDAKKRRKTVPPDASKLIAIAAKISSAFIFILKKARDKETSTATRIAASKPIKAELK